MHSKYTTVTILKQSYMKPIILHKMKLIKLFIKNVKVQIKSIIFTGNIVGKPKSSVEAI